MKQSIKTLLTISSVSILLLGFQNCGEGLDAARLSSLEGANTTYNLKGPSENDASGYESTTSTTQDYSLVVAINNSNQEFLAVKGPQGRTLATNSAAWMINLAKKFQYIVVRDPYKKEVQFVFLNTNRSPVRLVQLIYDGGFRHYSSSEENEIVLGSLKLDFSKDLPSGANNNDLQGLKIHRHGSVETLFVGKNRIRNKDIKVLGGADIVTFSCSKAGGDCAERCAADERQAWDGTCTGLVISCSNGEGTRTWNPQVNEYGVCVVQDENPVSDDDEPILHEGAACILIPGYDFTPPTMGIVTLFNGRLVCTYPPSEYKEGDGGK